MNYHLLYEALIDRARTRELTGYSENHHVVPKCLGGTDDKNNLVRLTAREHYHAHALLVKMHPTVNGLKFAVVLMTTDCRGNRINKRTSWIRRQAALANVGRKLTPEHVAKIQKTRKGYRHSAETRAKMSASATGRVMDRVAVEKMAMTKRGVKQSEEHRKKAALARLGKKRGPYKKRNELP